MNNYANCYSSRPAKLSEVSAQDHAVNVLSKTIQTNNVCFNYLCGDLVTMLTI